MRRRPIVFAFVSAPIDMLTSHRPPYTPCCSLRNNHIGGNGASKIAAVLKETVISELKCAATR